MASRSKNSQNKLKDAGIRFHNSVFSEDSTPVIRPPDVELYDFVDEFTESYSWREDILKNEIYIKVFSDEENKTTGLVKYNILRWLREERLLHFTTVDNDGWLLVSNVDEINLNKFIDDLNPEIVPANIKYSPSTGKVILNGVSHRMHVNRDTHKIFHYLATHPNERISKERIWRCINKRVTSKRDKNSYSSLINRVRTSVGASDKEILLDNTVTLNAIVEIID